MKPVKSSRPADGVKNDATTGKGVNFKGEAFPDINSLVSAVRRKCGAALSDSKCLKVKDILYRDRSSGRILVKKSFSERILRYSISQRMRFGVYTCSATKTTDPFYVGISSTVKRRLRQHFFGMAHNQASLAYLMGRDEFQSKRRINI